ncbi:MAG: hypothetical protein ABFS32_13940, partial [Bacteroidota bacterium]
AFKGITIGQHFRHSIEFLQCLKIGYKRGVINYDDRKRSKELETNKDILLANIDKIKSFLQECDITTSLELCVNYDPQSDEQICMGTNLEREIAYNIEHLIHHMALVKIGIREVCPNVILPPEFGLAISTIKYQNSLKQ